MDKRVLRERIRKKQQQIRRRQMMKKGAYIVAIILVFVFVIRGIILPVINRVGGKNTDKPAQVQAETDANANTNTGDSGTETQIEKDTNAAIRKPLKGASDLTKASQLTAGWHEDENGKWYQNSDGTFVSFSICVSVPESPVLVFAFASVSACTCAGLSVFFPPTRLMTGRMIRVSIRQELHLRLIMARESIQTSFWTAWNRIMHMRHSLCSDRMLRTGRAKFSEW